MAHRPAALAEAFLDAGADLVTVHAEADGAADALARIRARGAGAGIAFTLGTDPAAHRDLLRRADAIVMVGTPLGTAGTGMDPNAPRRIEAVKALVAERSSPTPVLADGGIRRETVPMLANAGADGVVAGSLLFKAPDPHEAADFLRSHRPAASQSLALCQGER
jgi:ribulose-phosphate 3-epimerase